MIEVNCQTFMSAIIDETPAIICQVIPEETFNLTFFSDIIALELKSVDLYWSHQVS